MGLYDVVRVPGVLCEWCGVTGSRGLQFKHDGSQLRTYDIGDVIEGFPGELGHVLIGGWHGCEACGEPSGDVNPEVEAWCVEVLSGRIVAAGPTDRETAMALIANPWVAASPPRTEESSA